MISNLLLVVSIFGFSLAITACGIFLFSNKAHTFANRLLAITLFSMASVMMVTFLLEWNIDYYAYVYRFSSPLHYLFLPTSYLYLRSVLYDEQKFRKWDVLHFLPALLHLIEMLPFYFTSYEYRQALTRQILADPDKLIELGEGALPPYYHMVIRCLQGSIYIFLMVRLLFAARRNDSESMPVAKTETYRWLVTLTLLIAVLAVPMIFYFAFPDSFFIQGTRFLLVVMSFSFLIINLYLFFQPQILYGIPRIFLDLPGFKVAEPRPSKIDNVITEAEVNVNQITPPATINLECYKPILESYIAREKPFLKQGYSISELSGETGIPQHHLSALLNRVYEMRFTDFLNGARINYIRENFSKGDWSQLTLEGIAKMAGFNSRTTFFNAIKKATGLTPSEFMADVKNHSLEKESYTE